MWRSQKLSKVDALQRYQKTMRLLAGPFVLVCAWRAAFPNIYASRVTWYDSMLCSIFISRMMATVAEVCWVTQICMALSHVDHGLRIALPTQLSSLHRYTQVVAKVSVGCICVAELCSDFGTITKSGLGFLLEETLWGVAFTLLLPAFMHLTLALRKLPREARTGQKCSATVFARSSMLVIFGYLVWQWSCHVPDLYRSWQTQLEDNVQYYSFGPGVWDALTERHASRSFDTWKPVLLWLIGYFSLGVWTSLALMCAPTVVTAQDGREGNMDLHLPAF